MSLPDPATLLLTLAATLAGLGTGWFHFASLARIAEMIVAGRIAAIWLQIARLVLIAALLWLCARGGALVLIAGAVGILAGRSVALRRAGR
ncbi:MAG: hypothetical protein H6895_02370 [Defluviimonas sp.]|uniref:N-ATPase subunit AtpR n=1 Tax=Albidovulum sp. TaxID=1872424 RepID=UPI002A2F8DBE|nr:hypothetical protein [Defluviimonas sp.]